MWGFLSDVRESVRQVMAPPPGSAQSSDAPAPGTSGGGSSTTATDAAKSNGVEGAISGITTELFRLWGNVNRTASKVLREAFEEAVPLKEEAVPPLFALSAEQRAALSTNDLLRLLVDGVTQTTNRAHDALEEANFLLNLSIEEQIAHTNDYVSCYEWWDCTVNRRLIACQEIIQSRLTASQVSAEERIVVMSVLEQMDRIRQRSTQPMAAVAARGRLLKDERYDLLRLLPASFPADAAPPATTTANTTITTTHDAAPSQQHNDPAPVSPASYLPPTTPPKPYIPQFKPFSADRGASNPTVPLSTTPTPSHSLNIESVGTDASDLHHATSGQADASSAVGKPHQEHETPNHEKVTDDGRLEREAEEARLAQEAAEEQARQAREAEEARLAQEAAEEQARREREAEEARFGREAVEVERVMEGIAPAASETGTNKPAFFEEDRLRAVALEVLRDAVHVLEGEEASARAKLSRAAQEVSTMLFGQMIMGAQMMDLNRETAAPVGRPVANLGAPHVMSGNNDGWGDDEDDGFEEVDMTPALLRGPVSTVTSANHTDRSSPWGGSSSNLGATSLSVNAAGASTRTPMCLTRDPLSAHKKKTPPSTPLANRTAPTAVPAATPTPLRRPGVMSLRKKSPPSRSAATTTAAGVGVGGGAVTGGSSGGFGSATPLSSVRAGATPASSGPASGVKPLHPSSVFSSPSTTTKQPGHQVKMDDDDKWDDDW